MRAGAVSIDSGTRRLLVLLGVTGIAWVAFHYLTDEVFLTPRNLSNLSVQMTITALLAIPVTWLLIAREIDLSMGAVLALVGVVVVHLQVKAGWATVPVIVLGLSLGALIGLLQGAFTVRLGVPSFIVTLAGFSWLRGVAFVIAGAVTLSGTNEGFYQLANGAIEPDLTVALCLVLGGLALAWVVAEVMRRPDASRSRAIVRSITVVCLAALAVWVFGGAQGAPYPVIILVAILAATSLASRHTAFGRHIYAIGGNPEAARRAGIHTGRVVLILFVFAGTMAGLGGILQASRLDSGPAGVGGFLALDAISAAIIGGTSLFGGRGTIVGAVLGALLMASVANGLSLMAVNTFYQLVATGLLLLFAVASDTATRRAEKR